MAISTYPVQLMYGDTPAKLVDIKDFPDLGGAPNSIDVTTMSDSQKVYIPGIQDTKQLEFTANYDKADYTTINGLTGEQKFQIWFGTDGADGKFGFSGEITAYVVGAGVDSAVDMKIVITPSTIISPVNA